MTSIIPNKKELWRSKKGRDARSKLKARENEFLNQFEREGIDSKIFELLMCCESLPQLNKFILKIDKHRLNIGKCIASGYMDEEPEQTPEILKVQERLNNVDDDLISRLKEKIGVGRHLKKFKYDYENQGIFARTLIKTNPVEFLQVPLIRNSIKKLYDEIDISDFELKQKETDIKPKELNERQFNAEVAKIEAAKALPKSPKSPKKPVVEALPKSPKKPVVEALPKSPKKPVVEALPKSPKKPKSPKSTRSVSSKKQTITEVMENNNDSDSDFVDKYATMSLRTIIKKKKRAYDSYSSVCDALLDMRDKEKHPEEYFKLVNDRKTMKGIHKKYKALEKNFGKQDDKFYDSDEMAASTYVDALTGECINLNDLARDGTSSMTACNGKKRKKYTPSEILEISEETSIYFQSDEMIEFLNTLDSSDKKQRYNKFLSLTKKFSKGKGSVSKYHKLIDAAINNQEVVCGILEDTFKTHIS
jgi:hypothetical protein